jgi:indolepyruvate ferredoxin oxidoreductase
VSLASVPEYIRGYGHVKERHLKDAKAREAALLARLRDGAPSQAAATVKMPVAAD